MADDRRSAAKLKKTSVVFLGFRRGGSSVFFSALQVLFEHSNYKTIDLVSAAADNGASIFDIRHRQMRATLLGNDLVGVFRDVPDILRKKYGTHGIKFVLLVRDPRDCVLSWYHARHLHLNDVFPPQFDSAETLPDYIRNGDDFLESATRLVDFAADANALVLRYEDLVRDPASTISEVVEFTAERDRFSREAINSALLRCNFLQVLPDVASHNRTGMCAQAVGTLEPELLEILNNRYRPLMARLQYWELAEAGTAARIFTVNRRELDSLKRYVLTLATENHVRKQDLNGLARSVVDLSQANARVGREVKVEAQLLSGAIEDRTREISEHFRNGLTDARKAIGEDLLPRIAVAQGEAAARRQDIEDLGKENGFRIVEIKRLTTAVEALRNEISEGVILAQLDLQRTQLVEQTREILKQQSSALEEQIRLARVGEALIQERERLREQCEALERERDRAIEARRAVEDQLAHLATGRNELLNGRDETVAARHRAEAETARLAAEQEALSAERDQLAGELAIARDETLAARQRADADIASLSAEKETLSAERDRLAVERDALAVERSNIVAERDGLRDRIERIAGSMLWRLLMRKHVLEGGVAALHHGTKDGTILNP